MNYFNSDLFSNALPFIAMYMDEKALLELPSVSTAANKCLSSNTLWIKYLYTRFCRENLEEGGAKLHYFRHMRVYRSFFEKALKIELPHHFIAVRELVEHKLKKGLRNRNAQLTNFFFSEFKRFSKFTSDADKTACDQNLQMLLKEGAKLKTLKRPNFLERAVINHHSFKTIEMMFDKGEKCRSIYIYEAIASRSRRISSLSQENEPLLFLAERVETIELKNQFRFCKILQAKISAPIVECLAAKVNTVCIDTLLCALQNKHSSITIEILYGKFKSDKKEDEKKLIDSVLSEKWYSDKTVKMFLMGASEIEERYVLETIYALFPDKIVGMIIEKVDPNVQVDPLDAAIDKGYSDHIVRLILHKFERKKPTSQNTLHIALGNRYASDIIHLLIDNLDPFDWVKVDVIKAAENNGHEEKIIDRLKQWQFSSWDQL